MPGFERNRFVDLLDSIADGLTCIVCLNIFDNPVITGCGHTYCYECIESNVKSGSHECPKCRKKLENKKFKRLSGDNNCIALNDGSRSFVFVRNLIVSSMVGRLRIKCDNESDGCLSVTQLDSLSTHLKQCEHQLCKACDFKVGKSEEHNCVLILKQKMIDLNDEYEQKLDEWTDKCSKLIEQNKVNINAWRSQCEKYEQTIEELQNMMSIHESNAETLAIGDHIVETTDIIATVNFVMFGTIETKCLHCRVDRSGIDLKGVSISSVNTDDSLLPEDLSIPYNEMQELKYCSELSVAVIIIKPTEKLSFEIQNSLQLKKRHSFYYGLCIYSYDAGKHYIIIMMDRKNEKLGSSLFQWSIAGNNRLKPVAITWKQTQDMLDRALRVKPVDSDDSLIGSVIDSD